MTFQKYKIYNEEVVNWARHYKKQKFHALLTDCPYHLTSITKRFGKKGSAPVKVNEFFDDNGKSKGSSPYSRTSKGFMGTQWDGGDLAFRPETWEAFGEVLHPGAFGMAFSASRNWHRMAVAIEDAGFILHPTIFLWAQGQGFPKATRVKGQEDFDGHRYGLQALKPAVEPIIIFQKRFEDKPRDNIVETGAGALNIDGARIPLANNDEYTINTFDDGAKPFGNGAGHKYSSQKIYSYKRKGGSPIHGGGENVNVPAESHPLGRWPANLILTDESAKNLDAQTGTLVSGKPSGKRNATTGFSTGITSGAEDLTGFGDAGGASRFFYNVSTKLDESDPVYYCGKVSPKERNAGLEDLEDKPSYMVENGSKTSGNPRTGERWERHTVVKNNHPTLKPIDLIRYLATLLLPPDEYAPRRIFIPFAGVASEMIGAGLAGWEHIVGVENDTENGYVEIAEKRLEHWLR